MILKNLLWMFLLAGFVGCATIDHDDDPPTITTDTPTSEALELAVKYGGPQLAQFKKLIKKRNAKKEVNRLLTQKILEGKMDESQTWRAVRLYQASSSLYISPKVVSKLISSDKLFHRQLGWLLAAHRPSDLVAAVLERYMTRALVDGDEEELYLPELALAVKANRIRSVYSILRQGLMAKGGAEFVEAMTSFEPEKSVDHLMDYLALANIEDLRQMNQKTVDLKTCMAILRHFSEFRVPISHPRFEHLFFYVVSRNASLSDLARIALQKYMPKDRDQLAYTLSRLPVWIQVAFVEGTREQMNANIGLFLSELKGVTSHREVVEEINALRR